MFAGIYLILFYFYSYTHCLKMMFWLIKLFWFDCFMQCLNVKFKFFSIVGQNVPRLGKNVNGSALHQAVQEIFLGTLHVPLVESNKTLYSSLDHPEVLPLFSLEVSVVHIIIFPIYVFFSFSSHLLDNS